MKVMFLHGTIDLTITDSNDLLTDTLIDSKQVL